MDGRLLLWFFGISGGYALATFSRRRGTVAPWFLAGLAAIVLAAAIGLLLPRYETIAAAVSGAAFGLLLLAPAVLIRVARGAAASGRFGRAGAALRLAARILPAEPLRSELALYRALAAADPADPTARDIAGRLRSVGGPRLRTTPVGLGLTLFMLAFHAVVSWSGDSKSLYTILRFGANCSTLSAGGEPYRVVTAVFLHVGLLHLVLNVSALFVVARWLESAVGGARLFLTFLLSGVAGNVASALVYAADGVVSAGASGGAMGLFGLALVHFHARRADPHFRQKVSSLAFAILATIGLGLVEPQIDNAAHVGGLAAGAALGLLYTRGRRLPAFVPRAAAAVAGALAAGAFLWLALRDGRYTDPLPYRAPEYEIGIPAVFSAEDEEGITVFSGPPLGVLTVRMLPDADPANLAHALAKLSAEARTGGVATEIDVDGAGERPPRPGTLSGTLTIRRGRETKRCEAFLVADPDRPRAALLTFSYDWPDAPFRDRVVLPVLRSFSFR